MAPGFPEWRCAGQSYNRDQNGQCRAGIAAARGQAGSCGQQRIRSRPTDTATQRWRCAAPLTSRTRSQGSACRRVFFFRFEFHAEFQSAPGIAKDEIDSASQVHGYCAVVGSFAPAAETAFELVDSSTIRYGFVLEQAAPIVALHSHLLEPQHVLPMEPPIGTANQRAIVVLPV